MAKTKHPPYSEPGNLSASTQWFHIHKAMFDQRDVAKMGPHAFTVYSAIKGHANYDSGVAFPSIELIAEITGISCSQVKRKLKVLTETGYLNTMKRGRSNCYTLNEKIHVTDENGCAEALATWMYTPSGNSTAVSDLKNAVVTGVLTGTKVVNIRRLKRSSNLDEKPAQIDFEAWAAEIETLSPRQRKVLRRHLDRCEADIHSPE